MLRGRQVLVVTRIAVYFLTIIPVSLIQAIKKPVWATECEILVAQRATSWKSFSWSLSLILPKYLSQETTYPALNGDHLEQVLLLRCANDHCSVDFVGVAVKGLSRSPCQRWTFDHTYHWRLVSRSGRSNIMKVTHSVLLPVCLVSALLALIIFMNGFFALKAVLPGLGTFSSQPVEPGCDIDIQQCQVNRAIRLPPVYGRMVFILIDALRADFVLPDSTSNLPKMKYVSELIENHQAYSFLAKAHPPTVTLPRIKVGCH